MSSDELNKDELDQYASNQKMLLQIFYQKKGNIDQINKVIDEKIYGLSKRSITMFEGFVKARLILNPKVLRLADMDITTFEMTYLSQYPGLENVEELDLRKNRLGDEGLEAFLLSEKIENIRALDLRNNQITRKGVGVLAATNKLTLLEKLDLRSNKIGPAWINKFKSTGNYPNLSSLKIV